MRISMLEPQYFQVYWWRIIFIWLTFSCSLVRRIMAPIFRNPAATPVFCPHIRERSGSSFVRFQLFHASFCNHNPSKIETISNSQLFSNHNCVPFSWGRRGLKPILHSLTSKHHIFLIGETAKTCISCLILICLVQCPR